tara:strand:+ start:16 stop:963 length:948 start_codon:yes stop_codon:yes gene_type:complete
MKLGNKIILVVISIIGLYAGFLIISDLTTISDKISNFNTNFIPLIFLLVTTGMLVLFLRWHLLLRNAKIFIPVKDSFLIYTAGFSLSIIPGKVGELIKSQLLKSKFDIPRTKTVPIVLLEQLYTVIGIIIISFFGIWYFQLGVYVFSFFLIALIVVLTLISSRRLFNKAIQFLGKRKFTSKFVTPLSSSYDSIKDGSRGRILLFSSGLSVIFWFIESVTVFLILMAFGINDIEFLKVIPTYTTSILLGILSFLPLGVGVVEGSLVGFFSLQGIETSLAFTVVIIIRLFTRWYPVSFGFIMLKISGGLKLRETNDT